MAERETGTLIGSDKVEGTAVYGRDGQKIGSPERSPTPCWVMEDSSVW